AADGDLFPRRRNEICHLQPRQRRTAANLDTAAPAGPWARVRTPCHRRAVLAMSGVRVLDSTGTPGSAAAIKRVRLRAMLDSGGYGDGNLAPFAYDAADVGGQE